MPPNIKWMKKELVWLKFNDDSIVKANIVQPGNNFSQRSFKFTCVNYIYYIIQY